MALSWETTQTFEIRIMNAKKEVLIKLLRTQLCKKFKLDMLPDELIQKIESAKISELENVADNIFDIESLEDVSKYLTYCG